MFGCLNKELTEPILVSWRPPKYLSEARKNKVTGEVKLLIRVRVSTVVEGVLETLPHGCEDAAIKAVEK